MLEIISNGPTIAGKHITCQTLQVCINSNTQPSDWPNYNYNYLVKLLHLFQSVSKLSRRLQLLIKGGNTAVVKGNFARSDLPLLVQVQLLHICWQLAKGFGNVLHNGLHDEYARGRGLNEQNSVHICTSGMCVLCY